MTINRIQQIQDTIIACRAAKLPDRPVGLCSRKRAEYLMMAPAVAGTGGVLTECPIPDKIFDGTTALLAYGTIGGEPVPDKPLPPNDVRDGLLAELEAWSNPTPGTSTRYNERALSAIWDDYVVPTIRAAKIICGLDAATRTVLDEHPRGFQVVACIEWPIVDQLIQDQRPGHDPTWIIVRGLCNGIPDSSSEFDTLEAAREVFDRDT